MSQKKHVILGGGITGLLHAYYALKRGEEVILLEAQNRTGGLIQSKATDYGLVETAANGILNNRLFEELCKDLGLKLICANKAAKRRYIYHNGRPRRLPLSLAGKLRLLSGIAFRDARPHNQESLADWAKRTLGPASVDSLVQPAFGGIYAGDVRRMDAALVLKNRVLTKGSMIRQMLAARKEKRSLRPETKGLVSLPNGMGSLIRALTEKVQSQGSLETGRNIQSLDELRDLYAPDYITVTCGLQGSLRLLDASMPDFSGQSFRRHLKSYDLATVTRFGREPLLPKPGFGLLFPPKGALRARGVLFNSFIFENRAKEGLYSESWIYGGAFDTEIAEATEEEILNIVEEDRRQLLPSGSEPALSVCHIWKNALPAYEPPLAQLNAWLDENLPSDLRVEGNFRYGIGLSAILERACLMSPSTV